MDLEDLRRQIDDIDREIVERLDERVRLASEIGHIKNQSGAPIYVPSRQEEVFRRVAGHNRGHLTDDAIRAIYSEIISAAIALEKPLKIAYLGPEATYTHMASLRHFGRSVEYLPLATIQHVFATVKRGEADYGVVPVENSTQGTVITTLDMLMETELTIVAQRMMEISHCLISQSPLDKITAVYSKDNALGQCREWLARKLPGVDLVDCNSTAHAVELAKENPTYAAIASKGAAELYDVPVVEEGINDKFDNVTRFLVIGTHSGPPSKSCADKTTIVFTLPDNSPGALIKALFPLSMRGINISKIESRPSRRKLWDYYFYVDVTGHRDDQKLGEALKELEEYCPFMRWLGSYPDTTG
ncbi:MAG: chorismate mutase / prephenate dehydratase [Puniceicoccaceae bacterium 5H]|nr:MAG: chorismate mutase / prephenate dehydratase [Puniceicoccaceae bacterium 5H]